MSVKKILSISLICLAVIAFAVLIIINRNQPADNYKLLPRSSDSNLPSEYVNAQKTVDYYRAEIEKHPKMTKNYIELAQVYLQEARITGNHHYYIPKADELVNEALNINPNDFESMITKASIYMIYHQFDKAKNLAEKVIQQNNYNAFAYGVLTDALVELGEYDKAVKSCDQMLNIRPDLRSYARASYLREIYGKTDDAIEAMLKAANAGVSGQENRAWTLYNLGNLFFNMGKLDSAEYIYNGILEERPNYGYALSGLADVNSARKNYSKAIELLVRASQATPNHIFIEGN
ncbi:MAG: tetratricopeptide repeat protein, partial [Ignavibacteriaceae bacterium]